MCSDMCIDMRIDVCIDMCIDLFASAKLVCYLDMLTDAPVTDIKGTEVRTHVHSHAHVRANASLHVYALCVCVQVGRLSCIVTELLPARGLHTDLGCVSAHAFLRVRSCPGCSVLSTAGTGLMASSRPEYRRR